MRISSISDGIPTATQPTMELGRSGLTRPGRLLTLEGGQADADRGQPEDHRCQRARVNVMKTYPDQDDPRQQEERQGNHAIPPRSRRRVASKCRLSRVFRGTHYCRLPYSMPSATPVPVIGRLVSPLRHSRQRCHHGWLLSSARPPARNGG